MRFAACWFLFVFAAPAQNTLHVSRETGSDQTGDGSAAKPLASIPAALARIRDAGPEKRYTVKVARGAYAGVTIRMRPHVDLLGGFEPATWNRDVAGQRTVLDGAAARRVAIGADHARLDGFLIRRGRVRGRGAGLLADGVSPVVTNNLFVDNMSLAPVPWEPKELHEVAHDGGAIACQNGCAAVIEDNLFVRNATEIGRGAAVAVHARSPARIRRNVFLDNTAGLIDPKRSSDGGAVSIYDHSPAEVSGNTFVHNRALNRNDGGGLFVALWSSAVVARNVFAGNYGDDDGGALFVGGQKHHYSTPFDPLPPASRFVVRVTGNVIAGNANGSGNSGAIRMTMETRAVFANNVVAENLGGANFQRSEVHVLHNTFVNPVRHEETKAGLKPAVFANNIFWGELDIRTDASVSYSNVRQSYPAEGNISRPPVFVDDGMQIFAAGTIHNPESHVTQFTLSRTRLEPDELRNRVVQIGDRWSVVKSNTAGALVVWGGFPGERSLSVLPAYRLAPSSPCIDSGTNTLSMPDDIDGRKRPQKGAHSLRVDMGAFEK